MNERLERRKLSSRFSSKSRPQRVEEFCLRFKKQFARVTGHTVPGVTRSEGGGQVFSQELRSAIERGCTSWRRLYRCTCTLYTDRLLFSMRPSTVRKFMSLYGEPGTDTGAYIQLSESSTTTINLLHSSLDQQGPSYIQR